MVSPTDQAGIPQATMVSNDPSAPTTVRVVSEAPVVFADAVSGQSYGPGISKFHLVRIDSEPQTNIVKPTLVLQIVMPTDGFVQMWAFFEHRLKMMIRDGVISKELIDKKRAELQALAGSSNEPL